MTSTLPEPNQEEQERSQALRDALADVIREAGGTVRCETLARKIVLKDGAVAGVKIADGAILPARAAVSSTSRRTLTTACFM